MLFYDKPKKVFLHNDLLAYESEENDKQLIYHFKTGYVTALGEYSSNYDNEMDKAYIIYNGEDVISVHRSILRIVD
ncbi:hypothetical protein CEQ21_14975 [Niallia circulans]|uniref:Uncharacterized protein n=1 Tax=Niallia circulans TaxID=1397 RepID=A0A553SIL4_NIACI|nr:hypothetical protein [Niallia circulans]TRZ36812.1 hypothetical protein CEQ21_14975 [Niallia circulans]